MMVPSLTCFVLSLGFLWPRPRMRPVCWEPGRTERAQTGIEKANQWSLVVVQCQTLSKHCKASHLYQLSTIPKTMQILSMTMIMILVSLTFSSRRITPPLLVPPWKPLLHCLAALDRIGDPRWAPESLLLTPSWKSPVHSWPRVNQWFKFLTICHQKNTWNPVDHWWSFSFRFSFLQYWDFSTLIPWN